MAKRIFLFVLTNILIVATITIVTSLLGVNRFVPGNYVGLAIFCLIWGFGGAFISLAISRWMAKKMMGVQVIDPQTRDPNLRHLVDRVHRMARAANLSVMPEVGIYESPELNAFATGPSRNRSLVAVSTGLLMNMNEAEVDGVLGHEVAHIANGDMVTMTLVQGVINAFVMFLARVIGFALSAFLSGRSEDSEEGAGAMGLGSFLIVFVLEIFFGFLGMLVVAAFSRYREFRADAGGARLAGKQKMIAALEGLQRNMRIPPQHQEESFATMQIFGRGEGLRALFSTHPPLEKRIAALQAMRVA